MRFPVFVAIARDSKSASVDTLKKNPYTQVALRQGVHATRSAKEHQKTIDE